MITPENYFQKINNVDLSKAPDALRSGHDLFSRATSNGANMQAYTTNATIQRVVNTYLEKLNAWNDSQQKQEPEKLKEIAKNDSRIIIAKPAKSAAQKIADILMSIESEIWDKHKWESAGDVDDKVYVTELLAEIDKEGIALPVSKSVADILVDENYHMLNQIVYFESHKHEKKFKAGNKVVLIDTKNEPIYQTYNHGVVVDYSNYSGNNNTWLVSIKNPQDNSIYLHYENNLKMDDAKSEPAPKAKRTVKTHPKSNPKTVKKVIESIKKNKIGISRIEFRIEGSKSGKTYRSETYAQANAKMRELLDNQSFSNLEYQIIFQDGYSVEGVIDYEPKSFWEGKTEPFTWHINTFWSNMAESNAAYLKKEDKEGAKKIITNYQLYDNTQRSKPIFKKGSIVYTNAIDGSYVKGKVEKVEWKDAISKSGKNGYYYLTVKLAELDKLTWGEEDMFMKNKPKAESTATKLEKIPTSVAFLNRWRKMNGKSIPIRNRKGAKGVNIVSFFNGLKKSIVEKQIRKTDQYAIEIIGLQKELVKLVNSSAGYGKVKIEVKNFDHLLEITNSYAIKIITALAKRFIAIQGKEGVKDEAKKLFAAMEKNIAAGTLSADDNYAVEMGAALTNYIDGKTDTIQVSVANLSGLHGLAGIPYSKKTDEKEFEERLNDFYSETYSDPELFELMEYLTVKGRNKRATKNALWSAISAQSVGTFLKKHDSVAFYTSMRSGELGGVAPVVKKPKHTRIKKHRRTAPKKALAGVKAIITFDGKEVTYRLPEKNDNFSEMTGHMEPYNTGRSKEYTFEPDWFSNPDFENECYAKMENIQDEIIEAYWNYKSTRSKKALAGETPAPTPEAIKPEIVIEGNKLDPQKLPQIIGSKVLRDLEFKKAGYEGKWKKLIGDPVEPYAMMVFANPGKGKSSLVIELFKYLAESLNKKCLYISKDEGNNSYTIQEKFERFDAWHDNIEISAGHIPDNLADYDYVAFDLMNDFNLKYDDFKFNYIEKYRTNGVSFVSIFKTTGDGNFRGNSDWENMFDVSININDEGYAQAVKNRFGAFGVLKFLEGNTERIYKYSTLQDAEKQKNRLLVKDTTDTAIVSGTDGRFWVVSPAYAEILQEQGFTVMG